MSGPLARTCLKCGLTFTCIRLRGRGPGFCSQECKAEYRKRYVNEWVKANTDRVREKMARRSKAFNDRNPDYFKKHYAKNQERRKQQSRAWYAANKARANKLQKAYNAAHPELIRALGRKSQSTRRAILERVFVEQIDPHVVFERDGGMCGICKQRVERDSPWEIDHMIPISRGGAHAYANVQLSHQSCNRAKRDTLPSGQPNLFQVAV